MSEKEYLYWLLHVPGMGAVSIFKLYEYFGSFREIWKSDEKRLTAAKILTPKRLNALLESKRQMEYVRGEYERLGEQRIRFVVFWEKEYPKRLEPFRDRPPGLFVRGEPPDDEVPSVAIVGARNCTEYGRSMAEYFGRSLSEAGVQIVSGLAAGVDGAAHKGALDAGKPTFAVLGCGINICYPRENYPLFSAMEMGNGGILSEFVPDTRPVSMNFPMRNRIISGLSDAVIIIEAREKSGSLITTDFALEQGREVFALPGRVTDGLSAGCNRLLQNGAVVCLEPSDILEYLGIKYEKKLTIHKNSEKRLAKRENMVYSFLDSRPRHLDEIVQQCHLTVSECVESLLKLELLGLIQQTENQYYCRKM